MELSKQTIAFLKYFSDINTNFKIEEGNRIRCVSVSRHIYTHAYIDEDFKDSFCIYDLKQFLGILSLFQKPIIEFDTKVMRINDAEKEGTEMKFIAGAEETLNLPKTEFREPEYNYVIDLKAEDISSIQSAGNLLKSPHLQFVGQKDGVYVKVTDMANKKSSNDFKIKLESTPSDFIFTIKYEYFKLFAGNYRVHLSERGLIKFENLDFPIITAVAIERQ